MNASDWKCELNRLLEIFERESETSLRKISQCFVALGRPFDENFRKYFLHVSSLRLDTSFSTISMEQFYENQLQTASNSNELAGNANISRSKHAVPMNEPDNETLPLELKVENNADATIEIIDSDDESGGKNSEVQITNGSNKGQQDTKRLEESSSGNGLAIDEQNDASSVNENGVEVDVKCEPKTEIETETEEMDLEFVAFDPNKENDVLSVEKEVTVAAELLIDRNQRSSSPNVQKNRSKHDADKRFKCKYCAYTSQYKSNVTRHQLTHESATKPFKCEQCDHTSRDKSNLTKHKRTHDIQKSMGIVQNSIDGLYKCTHCDQWFTKWHGLRIHMKQTQKNNQRLFNCDRCMRRFTRKSEKDRHELQCKNRLYECFLCKTYVARRSTDMQRHMGTHSGARPFQCAICNRSYRQKVELKHHLNSIHCRT